ncbi:hypothetical protein HN51_058370 [Arachis hypogaea]
MAALWQNGVGGFGLAAICRPPRRAYHGGAKGAAIAVAPWRENGGHRPSPPPVAVRRRPSPLVVTAAHHHSSLFFLQWEDMSLQHILEDNKIEKEKNLQLQEVVQRVDQVGLRLQKKEKEKQ